MDPQPSVAAGKESRGPRPEGPIQHFRATNEPWHNRGTQNDRDRIFHQPGEEWGIEVNIQLIWRKKCDISCPSRFVDLKNGGEGGFFEIWHWNDPWFYFYPNSPLSYNQGPRMIWSPQNKRAEASPRIVPLSRIPIPLFSTYEPTG